MCSSLLECQSPGVGTLRRLPRWPRHPAVRHPSRSKFQRQTSGQTEHAKYDLATICAVKRRTVSLTDDALEALDRIAKEHRSTVSGVLQLFKCATCRESNRLPQPPVTEPLGR